MATNVFHDDFYAALAVQLKEILDRRLTTAASGPGQGLRRIPGYDAYGVGFDRMQDGALGLFHTTGWRDLLSGLFEMAAIPYVFAGAHFHAIGSRHGFIHKDCNPVWFPAAAGRDIQIPNYAICDYKTGTGTIAASDKVQVVRGVAMIFYLLNDGWRPGDGGETGLYETANAAVDRPVACCPPLNNSLVAFECTPQSFHSFMSNGRIPRISIIMWVHRPLEDAVTRFGADRLEQWK